MTAEEYTKLRETSASASGSPAAPPSSTSANTPTSTILPPPSEEVHQNIPHNVEEAVESKVQMGRTTATVIGGGVPRLPDAPPTHET